MINRVGGNICGCQSLLVSAMFHFMILMLVAVPPRLLIEQNPEVEYFKLVTLETEIQKSLGPLEEVPEVTSKPVMGLLVSEENHVPALKVLPDVLSVRDTSEKMPMSVDKHTDGENAPHNPILKDLMISKMQDENSVPINGRESLTFETSPDIAGQIEPPKKIQSKIKDASRNLTVSDSFTEQDGKQINHVRVEAYKIEVPPDKLKVESNDASNRKIRSGDHSQIVVTTGNKSADADLARETMKQLLGKKPSRIEHGKISVASGSACKTGNNVAVDVLPNTTVHSTEGIIRGNANIRISNLLGGANYGFSDTSGMTVAYLLNNTARKFVKQKPSEAVTIRWLLDQHTALQAIKCER